MSSDNRQLKFHRESQVKATSAPFALKGRHCDRPTPVCPMSATASAEPQPAKRGPSPFRSIIAGATAGAIEIGEPFLGDLATEFLLLGDSDRCY